MTTFAVFANGIYWGAFESETANSAIQMAADEHGTDGNTDGMTATTLSDYVRETKEGCASNGVDMNDLVREFFNCADAEVNDQGDIWIANPQNGHWIDAEKKSNILAWIASA
jgi:hypothetical protein